MLQKQIDDLKQQLSSQTSLISQLCKPNKRKNKLKSVDFDQVIIEEDNEDGHQESKFDGELSIVAAAANNQGEIPTDGETTQVIEDLSLLRKLSIELNKNYEKFNEFRRSLNIYNNNNKSVSQSKENIATNVAQEVEKQFKSLLQERLIQSQREKHLIEEALGKCQKTGKQSKPVEAN